MAIVVLEGVTYKETVNTDVVVMRHIQLLSDNTITTGKTKDPADKKSWRLDAHCQLSPRAAEDIVAGRKKRIRERGMWTITATVTGEGKPLALYLFHLTWPKSMLVEGYTSVTLGFESSEEAQRWHRAIAACIAQLNQQGASPDTGDTRVQQRRLHLSMDGQGTPSREHQCESAPTSTSTSTGHSPFMSYASIDPGQATLGPDAGSQPSVTGSSAGPLARRSPAGQETPASTTNSNSLSPAKPVGTGAQPSELSATTLVEGAAAATAEEVAAAAAAAARSASPSRPQQASSPQRVKKKWSSVAARWVPHKQTNGVAIYRLDDAGPSGTSLLSGGEFMVSAVVRGPPDDVLTALLHGSSHTTILGPASEVQVLDSSSLPGAKDADAKDDREAREVLRFVLEAEGWAGRLCAPREMIVERVLKRDANMFVVVFSSMEQHKGLAGDQRKVEGSSKLRSWYRQPVTGWVQGTYVISPLQGQGLDASPESMITCIIKVDLRGACGASSWLHPVTSALGWTEAFLDRILMSVILVRDEVEHSRFELDWQKVLTPGGLEQEEEVVAQQLEQLVSSHDSSARALDKWSTMRTKGMAVIAMMDRRPSLELKGVTAAQMRRSSLLAAASSLRKPSVIDEDIAEAATAAAAAGLDDELLPVLFDLQRVKALSTMDPKYWEDIHAPGKPCPFMVRGPNYLKDKKKVPGGLSAFSLASMDWVSLPHPVEHVARYLPSIRESGAPFSFVINLIIPGVPLLSLVATFASDRHPSEVLAHPPKDPLLDNDWQPFDHALYKFMNADEHSRAHMLKLIPRIADGSWVIKNAVGSTPVLIGKALPTKFFLTDQYMEIDIDVSANSTAAYITGMVRGAVSSLVVDMGFVIEGTAPWELPECLLGAMRVNRLEVKSARPLDMSREVPLRPAAKKVGA